MRCDICNRAFSNKKSFSNHYRNHDPIYRNKTLRQKTAYCKLCGKAVTRRQSNIKDIKKTFCSHSCCTKYYNDAERNPKWKGNAVGYKPLHVFVRRRIPKPQSCPRCGEQQNLDLHNINGKYKRKLSDWEWLCRKCHQKEDGRYQMLKDGLLYRGDKCALRKRV